MIGAGVSTPKIPLSQPHWYTATTAPNETPIDSRNPRAATTGTTTDRKINNSSTSARPTTINR